MLNDRENSRLHEIERELRETDPSLVRRFGALETRTGGPGLARLVTGRFGGVTSVQGSGPLPTTLLALSLVVLIVGAVAVNVVVVVAGIVAAVLSLGVAASQGPQAGASPA